MREEGRGREGCEGMGWGSLLEQRLWAAGVEAGSLVSRIEESPRQVAQLAGASSHTPKDGGFDSRSGHKPRLRV